METHTHARTHTHSTHTHILGFAELFLRVLSASSLISLSPWDQGHEKRVSQGARQWRPVTNRGAFLLCGGAVSCVQCAWGAAPGCVQDVCTQRTHPQPCSQTTQERDLGGRRLLTKTTIITVNLNWELIQSQLCGCSEHFTVSIFFDLHDNCTRQELLAPFTDKKTEILRDSVICSRSRQALERDRARLCMRGGGRGQGGQPLRLLVLSPGPMGYSCPCVPMLLDRVGPIPRQEAGPGSLRLRGLPEPG